MQGKMAAGMALAALSLFAISLQGAWLQLFAFIARAVFIYKFWLVICKHALHGCVAQIYVYPRLVVVFRHSQHALRSFATLRWLVTRAKGSLTFPPNANAVWWSLLLSRGATCTLPPTIPLHAIPASVMDLHKFSSCNKPILCRVLCALK